jgi:hypothetical protein
MNIDIVGTPEPEALGQAVLRAMQFRPDGHVVIHCPERLASGWLEYLLSFRAASDRQDYLIACIQREPGASFEFHS